MIVEFLDVMCSSCGVCKHFVVIVVGASIGLLLALVQVLTLALVISWVFIEPTDDEKRK